MTMVSGGISREAQLSLQHVDKILTALNVVESLQSVVHGFCFLTSSVSVPVAKNAWSCALKDKVTGRQVTASNVVVKTIRESSRGQFKDGCHGSIDTVYLRLIFVA